MGKRLYFAGGEIVFYRWVNSDSARIRKYIFFCYRLGAIPHFLPEEIAVLSRQDEGISAFSKSPFDEAGPSVR